MIQLKVGTNVDDPKLISAKNMCCQYIYQYRGPETKDFKDGDLVVVSSSKRIDEYYVINLNHLGDWNAITKIDFEDQQQLFEVFAERAVLRVEADNEIED